MAVEIAEAIQNVNNMYMDALDWHPFRDAGEESYDSIVGDIKGEIEDQLRNKEYEREADTITEATA